MAGTFFLSEFNWRRQSAHIKNAYLNNQPHRAVNKGRRHRDADRPSVPRKELSHRRASREPENAAEKGDDGEDHAVDIGAARREVPLEDVVGEGRHAEDQDLDVDELKEQPLTNKGETRRQGCPVGFPLFDRGHGEALVGLIEHVEDADRQHDRPGRGQVLKQRLRKDQANQHVDREADSVAVIEPDPPPEAVAYAVLHRHDRVRTGRDDRDDDVNIKIEENTQRHNAFPAFCRFFLRKPPDIARPRS